ncbi:uncharacterized protein LOC128181043 [Crassostrea angulata]|uniref:uncharacterized protein LOC128181043 n=1 Tax=Magallana angulata TaxID=2784310 RepID=UPI0022B09319|nr:uncharacterized protein LOC128181043 [Crassostrea angulata]
MWATNVGNEYGQVIMSVLTTGEGFGLSPMIRGLIRRYKEAEVPPPHLLYVDRDCCGNNQLRRMFSDWPELSIRLDIWHFMRRLSVGCTTDAHALYATFMSRLSQCIYMWDPEDVEALVAAKKSELEAMHVENQTDDDVFRHIKTSELAMHCRRTTRGVEETTRLISQLIQSLDGDKGRDTQGVPLINSERMAEIWKQQQKHVQCIQDPPNVQLYTQTGVSKKGGGPLPVYRCARGSTSLECFHLHLARFIPGTLANATLFQAYLLDGLNRWNQDRGSAATTTSSSEPQTYSGLLRHTANSLGETVFGKKMVPSYTAPHKYTGELLGVEYLYSQTGKVLQDIDHDDAEEEVEKKQEEEVEEEEDDEGFGDAEDFIDFTIPPLEVPPPSSTEQHSSPSVTVQRQPKPIQSSSMEQHSSPSVTVQRQPKPIQPSSTEQHSSPSVTVQRQPKPILHIPTVEEYRQAAVSGLLESSVPSSPHSIQKEDQREITETDDVAQVFRLERADASIGTVHF